MSGVINLRGSVVPVVDLRLCFEMSKTERTRNTCIVVVEVLLDKESTVIGALADSVEEVIDLEPDQIQPAPRIGTQIRTDFIKGMGKRDTQFIMILDIDRVFSAEELRPVRGAERQNGGRGKRRLRRGMRPPPRSVRHGYARGNDFERGFWPPSPPDLRTGGHQSERGKEDDARASDQAAVADLNLTSYAQYCEYLFARHGQRERDRSFNRCRHHE